MSSKTNSVNSLNVCCKINLWHYLRHESYMWLFSCCLQGIAFHGKPISNQIHGASPAMWDHAVLPSTRHRWTHAPQHQPYRPILDFPTPEGWKAELIFCFVCIPRWSTCLQTVSHPSSMHLIATLPVIDPKTSWLQV